MKVLLSPVGSRGDIQPQLVLALELRRRGHEVTFATCPNFRAMVETEGFECVSIGRDSHSLILENSELAEQNPLRALPRQLKLVSDETTRQCTDLLAAKLPQFELVVGAGLSFAVRLLSEKTRAKYAFVCYTLAGVESLEHPPPTLPVFGLPRFGNRALWRVAKSAFARAVGKPLAAVRKLHGLAPDRAPWSSIHGTNLILAQDEVMGPLPPDARGCGAHVAALTRASGEAPLPDVVENFLQRRGQEPLVYVGFGSMPTVERARVVEAVTELCRVHHARALLFSAHDEDQRFTLPDAVLSVGALDHARLFPRVDLVVHHGGAGTTATALRAGIPQLIVPHIVDQFFHARRIAELGIGPEPVKKQQLRARLCALSWSDIASMRIAAQRIAATLTPSGAPAAARYLESLVEPCSNA